jgi:hypothetical protein
MGQTVIQKKVFDESTLLFDAVDTSAWTFATKNSSIINLAAWGGYDAFRPPYIQLRWPGLSSAGASTFQIQLVSDNSATPTTVIYTGPGVALTLANAKLKFMDQDWIMHLPLSDLGNYFRLNIILGIADLNGGTLTAGLVK